MNVAVITASIGERRRRLYTPSVVSPDVRYLAFIDRPMWVHRPWEAVRVEGMHANARTDAKQYKILAHRFLTGVDAVIWIDAGCRLVLDPVAIWSEFPEPLGLLRHWRNCIYHESRALRVRGRADAAKLQQASDMYRQLRHPSRWGLFYGGLVLRRITCESNAFAENWWRRLLQDDTGRDQLSLPVSLRRTRLPYHAWPKAERGRLMRVLR